MNRSDLVLIAHTFLGTPFHHQGRLPGVGLDCAGVVVCALKRLDHPVADHAGYGRIPSQGIFTSAINAHCDQIQQDEIEPGDLMMFAFRAEPQHVAIVSATHPVMLIHAYQDVGRVVENGLDATWQSRLRGCYRIRGIA
ncbi:MAG: hypothetical protein A2143_02310 [Gallionellales bacterium RBG_16_57_15]|nr:MAG: hypothetical protein A2143_02310 [Gallionellales bacterium RBG_16_57_15]